MPARSPLHSTDRPPLAGLRLLCATAMVLFCASACDSAPSRNDTVSSNLRIDVVEPDGDAMVPVAKESHGPRGTTRAPIRAAGAYHSQGRPLYDSQNGSYEAAFYSPPSGSRERKDLMDAIRLRTRAELGTHAVFVVRNLRSNGQWAFAQLEPQHPDGSPINPHTTPAHQHNPAKLANGIAIDAIWIRRNGNWQVYDHQIGARDVWWLAHCDVGAAAVLPGC